LDSRIQNDTDRTEARLLLLASVFLGLFSLGLTLSPAVRLRTWETPLKWDHWAGYAAWIVTAFAAHITCRRRLPDRDPYLLPAGLLLSGWGLLTIWRLSPGFGLRQGLWLIISLLVLVTILRLPLGMGLLRRYKYIWLTAGLALTALTLVLGTNPSGGTPRLWLGCCGVYLQPSEPLKLLLIIYLAAYLSDRQSTQPDASNRLLPLLGPTLIMVGLALLLLGVQRDLGTASVFLFLYAVIVYTASGRGRILLISAVGLVAAGVAGYLLFAVVRIRVDAWINPWLDPSGGSYQIVQSLLAVANGGLIGRGPGLGSPGLVPVPHSDFIYSSIVEETGLAGGLALLLVLAIITNRGLRLALASPDPYRRYLAAGLTSYFVGQSILIIGGNLRLLPLTGVTLPFVSYGGSSLLISFISLGLLLRASSGVEPRAAPTSEARPYQVLSGVYLTGLAALALLTGWWTVARSPELLRRTDNPRRSISDRLVKRGSLLDRNERPIMESTGIPGEYVRSSLYPQLGPVEGYTHPVYGQSGLEASLDPFLRGLEGNPQDLIWRTYLLYGTPPSGQDVRLTIDLDYQRAADDLLGDSAGAIALVDALTGNILAMASHPTFDPNTLDADFEQLISDPLTPLFDRVALGQYPPGTSLGAFLLAAADEVPLPEQADLSDTVYENLRIRCAIQPSSGTWTEALANGCPKPALEAAEWTDYNESDPGITFLQLFAYLGLFDAPAIELETAASPLTSTVSLEGAALGQEGVTVSPLQMALAAASITQDGARPAPRLVDAIRQSDGRWVSPPRQGESVTVFSAEAARRAAGSLSIRGEPFWRVLALAFPGDDRVITWCVGGTLPGRPGIPLSLAVVLEEQDPQRAEEICRTMLLGLDLP
jgi:cell division protein FtsW (lipid II flippase)